MSGTNSRGALALGGLGITPRQRRLNEIVAMEGLPPCVRRAVAEHSVNLSVVSVRAFFQSVLSQVGDPERAAEITMRKLLESEQREIGMFAAEYQRRYRLPLPAVAANATILRYGALRSRRRVRAGMIRGFGLA